MDFIFSTACYVAATLFVLWLRYVPSQPQVQVKPELAETPVTKTEAPEAKPEVPAIADPWETPVAAPTSTRLWIAAKPQQALPVLALSPAKEIKPAQPTKPEIDLNALDAVTLRKLCSSHKIQWRDVRGKNRHATKTMMINQLQAIA